MKAFYILVLCVVAMPMMLQAQAIDYERSRYNPAAYYKYQEAGDITILVNVWGSVQNPGLYEVPRGTHLNWLFSAAGGPDIGVTTWGSDQRLTVRLLRAAGGESRVVFETVMEDEVFVPEENPMLQDGDILVVERYTAPNITWRDIFPVIGAVGSLTSTILAIIALSSSN